MAAYRRVDDSTCGLTACTQESAPGPTLSNEYGKSLISAYTFAEFRKKTEELKLKSDGKWLTAAPAARPFPARRRPMKNGFAFGRRLCNTTRTSLYSPDSGTRSLLSLREML